MRRSNVTLMRRAGLFLVVATVIASGSSAAPADGNLLPNGSFEGSLAGWSSLGSATLALVDGGVAGAQAARATQPEGSTSTSFGLIASPPVIPTTTAGQSYNADGWVRSSSSSTLVCLRVRERLSDLSYVFRESCLTISPTWQRFPTIVYTTAADGNRLDLHVSAYRATGGATFEVDDLSFSADVTPPGTTIDSAPASYTATSDASFAFSSSEPGSTFLCGLDGDAPAPCVSPRVYTALSDGVHTLQVAAVDAAGNIDPTPAGVSWTIDTSGGLLRNGSFEGSLVGWTGLNTTLGLASDGTIGGQAALVALPAGSAATSFGLITSPAAVSATTQGTIFNAVGWVRSDTPGRQVCLRVRERRANGTYVFASNCVTSTATWQRFPTVAYSPVAPGNRLDVYVSEYGARAGDSFEVDGLWLGADGTPPDTTITSGPPGYTNTTAATFAFASSEAGSTFRCSLDGQPPATCTSPRTYSELADGKHRLEVTAVDPAGLPDPTPAEAPWTIDTSGGLLFNGSFEGSTSGWSGLMGTLGLVAGGVVGTQAAVATLPTGSTATSYGLIASPPAIASTEPGRTYEASAWVRGSRKTRTVCLRLRERQADGSYLYGESCAALTGNWQELPRASYTAVGGGRLDAYLVTYGAQAGDTLQADGIWLKRVLMPPAAETEPSISGNPLVGETLTASPGTWKGLQPIALAYQWRLCDRDGASCADVAGATGTTFTLGTETFGRTVGFTVSATNLDGSTAAVADATQPVGAVAPAAAGVPSIAGTAQNGSSLTGSAGTWTGTQPITLAYQWRRCDAAGAACADVPGATRLDYLVTFADVDHTVTLAVTATNMAGSATVTSSPTGVAVDTVQPSFPIRATFYYPWYPEAWKRKDHYPYTHYNPTLGLYDSGDEDNVIRPHIAAMQYGKIQAGIASWWGIGDDSDANFPKLLSAAADTTFRWASYYEPEGQGNPSVSEIRAHLEYLRDHYGHDPSYLRVGGRFVVFVYDGGLTDACAMVDRWKDANTVGAHIVLKVFTGHRDCPNQPDGWHQYAPASATSNQAGKAFSISPGFWRARLETADLVRDPARWNTNIRSMIASTAPWHLIATFNEWGEGSSVESAAEWASPSGYGIYLDALHEDGLVNGTFPPANTSEPTIAAAPNTEPGAIVSASEGAWTGTPTAYNYRWRRCDSAGTTCGDIVGALAPTYVPPLEDVGSTLRVVVTAVNAGGSTSVTSDQSGIIVPTTVPDTTGICTGAAPPARWEHVVWIWMENKAPDEVLGTPGAPYQTQLASACGSAIAYNGITNPSLPNYLAATSGDTWGIKDNDPPAKHPLTVPSIFSQLTAAGLTWRTYAESSPGNCPKVSTGSYSIRHDPTPYYVNIAAECAQFDVPAGSLAAGALYSDLQAGTLPHFANVTPNICNDTHNCPVQAGDNWLRSWLPKFFASSNWQAGNTVIFIVWDESHSYLQNLIPHLVLSPSTVPGTQSSTAFTHYSLLRTVEENFGLPLLANAASATNMRADFNLGSSTP